jgi:hypothetical protein
MCCQPDDNSLACHAQQLLEGTRARHSANYRVVSLVGLERPRHHFGHGTVCKSGVAPAQHGVLPASKLSVVPCATSSYWGTCSIAEGNMRVTDKVICVFHAPVTFPRWTKRWKSFDIVKSPIIKEASKTEKVRNVLPSDLQETVVSIFMVESPPTPLYLLGNIQSGKSKKKF